MQRTQARHRELKGFTLIEILVVVAIIALLISILLPALGAARAQTRQTICLANLHNIGLAMQSFIVVSKGQVPRGSRATDDPNWVQLFAPSFGLRTTYTNPNQLPVDKLAFLHCPEREMTLKSPFLDFVANAMNPNGPANGTQWDVDKDQIISSNISIYKNPAQVIYACDAEREDKNDPGTGQVSLATARDNWSKHLWSDPAIDMMDFWSGSHLPEGNGVGNFMNTSDAKGPRRVARKMHLQRLTNATFYDGHAEGVNIGSSTLSQQDKHARWLRLFGVKNVERAKTITLKAE